MARACGPRTGTRPGRWWCTRKTPSPAPLATPLSPRSGVEVPILEGTDDAILDRGVGHIEDTALPGTDGNSGLAGHRDGFFRALKDITAGDTIELQTLGGRET